MPTNILNQRYTTEYDKQFNDMIKKENTAYSPFANYVSQPLVVDKLESDLDYNFISNPNDPYGSLGEHRGTMQSGLNKLGRGLVQGGARAGLTAIDGILGTAVGLANMANKEDGSSPLYRFINNPVSRQLKEWEDQVLESNPIYSSREDNNATFFGQLGTARFWGDQISNTGFMAGMLIDAAITGGTIRGITGAAKLASRIPSSVIEAGKAGKDISKIAGVTEDIMKDYRALQKINGASLVGTSVLSAQGEARFEAISNSKDFYDRNKVELDAAFESGEIDENTYQIKDRKLKEATEGMANIDFLANTAILGASGALQFKNQFARGFKPNKSIADNIEGSIATGYTYAKPGKIATAANVIKNPLVEGQEEQSQFIAQKAADDFYQRQFDEDKQQSLSDAFNSLYKGMAETYGTREGWDQWLSGAITGGIGLPSIRKTESGGIRPDWVGGIWGDIADVAKENEYNQRAVDNVNESINSPSFKNNLNSLIRTQSLEDAKNTAAANNDKFTFLDREHDQLIDTALKFIKADKIDDFEDYIEAYTNIKPTELRELLSQEDNSELTTFTKKLLSGYTPKTKDEIAYNNDNKAAIESKAQELQQNGGALKVDTFKNYSDKDLTQHLYNNVIATKDYVKNIKNVYDGLTTKYPSLSPKTIDNLVYVTSSLDNVNKRIKDINQNNPLVSNLDPLSDSYAESANNAYKEGITNGNIKPGEAEQFKEELRDLPKLYAKQKALADTYLHLTEEQNLLKEDAKNKKTEQSTDKEKAKSTSPNKGDIVTSTSPATGKTVQGTVVDSSAKNITIKTPDGNTTTVPKADATITPAVTTTNQTPDINTNDISHKSNDEAINLDESSNEDKDIQGTGKNRFKLKSLADAVSLGHKGPEGDFVYRDQEFNDYISDGDNDLKDDVLEASIDLKDDIQRWDKIPKDVKSKLDKGIALTDKEADDLLNIKNTSQNTEGEELDTYNSPVDLIPIKVAHKTKDNKEYSKEMYLHDSNYVSENTLNITDYDIAKIKSELIKSDPNSPATEQDIINFLVNKERARVREMKRKIAKLLLTGNKVTFITLQKTRGILNNTEESRNITDILKTSKDKNIKSNDIQLGIVETGGNIYLGNNTDSKEVIFGTPGTVVFFTDKTANKSTIPVHANISKLSEEHAKILLSALRYKYTRGFGKKALINNDLIPGVEGLTVEQIIDILVVKQQNPNDIAYLRDKVLYDKDKKVFYGNNPETNTPYEMSLLNPSNEEMQIFIDHLTTNKNYAVHKSLTSGTLKLGLNEPIKGKFKLGSIIANGKSTYSGLIIDNNMITANVEEYKKTGSLTRDAITIFDYADSNIKVEKKIIPTTTTPVSKPASTSTSSTTITNNYILNKGSKKATIDILESITIGSKIVSVVTEVGNTPEETIQKSIDYGVVIINNKGEKVLELIKPIFDAEGEFVNSLPINSNELLKIINSPVKSYVVILPETAPVEIITPEVKSISPPVINLNQFKAVEPEVEEAPEVKSTKQDPNRKPNLNKLKAKPLGDQQYNAFNYLLSPSDYNNKYQKWNPIEELGWLKEMLGLSQSGNEYGYIRVEDLIRVGDEQAFGQFRKEGIILSDKAKEGIVYHEGFHYVSIGLLSPEERANLYSDAKIAYNMKDARDIAIEERLADEFTKYVLARRAQVKTSLFGKIKRFFERLYNLLYNVFTGNKSLKQSNINRLFKAINKGKYKNLKPTKERLDEIANNVFNMTYRDIKLNAIKTKSQFDSIIKALTSIVMTDVTNATFKSPNDIKYSRIDIASNIQNINFNKVIPTLETQIEVLNESNSELELTLSQLNPNNKELLDDLEQIYGTREIKKLKDILAADLQSQTNQVQIYKEVILNYDNIFKEKIINYIHSNLNIKTTIPDLEEADNKSTNDFINDKSDFEYNKKNNIKTSIKFLIQNLRLSENINQITGAYDYVQFHDMWYNLLSLLEGKVKVEDMINTLDNAYTATKYLPYKELAYQLRTSSEIIRTQFETTFNNHNHNFINIYVEKIDGKYNITVGSANTVSIVKEIIKSWSGNFKTLSITDYNSAIERFEMLQSIFKGAYKNKDKDTSATKLELIQILNKVNIPINNDILNFWLNNIINSSTKSITELDALYDILVNQRDNNYLGFLLNKKSDIYKYINKDKVESDKFDTKFILLNEKKVVTNLAEAFNDASPTISNNMVVGAEGNSKYAAGNNTYVTDTVKRLKTEGIDYINYIMKDSWHKGSYVLNMLSENPSLINNLQLDTLNMMLLTNSQDTGTEYLDISPIEDFLMKLELTKKGKLIFPTLADKKLFPTLSGIRLTEEEYDNGESSNIPDSVVDIFYNYFISEKDRIEKAETTLLEACGGKFEKFKSTKDKDKPAKERETVSCEKTDNHKIIWFPEKLINQYHYTVNDKGEYNTNEGNAYKYQWFSSFNTKNIVGEDNIKKEIKSIIKSRINETFRYAKTSLNIINDKNELTILTDNYLKDNSTSAKDILKVNDYNNKYKQIATNNILSNYTINTMMSSIETMYLFTGDIAYFKNDNYGDPWDDYTKRLSALAASGEAQREIVPNEFDTDGYNSTVISTQNIKSVVLNNIVALQTRLLKKKYPELDDNGINELLKPIIKEYSKINSTDGAVLISPEFSRGIEVRRGSWSPEQQDAYNLLESDRELSDEEEQRLLNIVLQPKKYVTYDRIMHKSNSGDIYVPVYDKMSLATMFRRYSKGTHMETILDRMELKGDYESGGKYNKDGLLKKIHMLKFDSAVKTGVTYKENIFDNTSDFNVRDLSNLYVTNQNISTLRHQVYTDVHDVDSTLFGSQVKKVVLSNIKDDDLYYIEGEDTPVKGIDLKYRINKSLATLSNKGLDKYKGSMNIDSDNNISMRELYKELYKEAIASNLSESTQDMLRNEVSLDILPDRTWIFNKLLSKLNKNVIKTELPGKQLIQVTGFAKANGQYSNNLRFLFDEAGTIKGLEAKVSISIFKKYIPEGITKFEDKVNWLLQNKSILEGLGYRIPTQGQNSTVPIIITEFYPESAGDVITLPDEFIALTGSDFDIDKLFFITYNYEVKDNKLQKIEFKTNNNSTVEQRYNKIIEEQLNNYNKILDGEVYTRYQELKQKRYEQLAVKADLYGDIGQQYKALVEEKQVIIYEYIKNINNKELVDFFKSELDILDKRIEELDLFNENYYMILDIISDYKNEIRDKLIEYKVLPTLDEFSKLDIIEQNTKKAVQNYLLDHYRQILLSDNHLLEATTPLGNITGKLKKLAGDIVKLNWMVNENKDKSEYDKSRVNRESLSHTDPLYQSSVKYKYSNGKLGVGPSALNNVHHILTQMVNLNFKAEVPYTGGLKDLSRIVGEDGINILDWLSAMIDAHVDIAKDPYIINLGINEHTFNTAFLLLRLGVGNNTFKFLSQSSIKKLVRYKIIEEGNIKPETKVKAFKRVTQEYTVELNKLLTIYNKEHKTKLKDKALIDRELDGFNINTHTKFMSDIETKNDAKDYQWYVRQLAYLNAFNTLENGMGKLLNKLVMASRVDTEKYGKSFIEIDQYLKSVEEIKSLDIFENVENILGSTNEFQQKDTFIPSYINNGPKFFNKVFGKLSITNTELFKDLMYQIYNNTIRLKKGESISDRLLSINNTMLSVIQGKFFTNELNLKQDDITNILQEVPKTLTKLMSSEKYKDLQENRLLDTLNKGKFIDDKIKSEVNTFLGLPTGLEADATIKEDLMYNWIDLLDDSRPEVVEFANKLFIYSYYTSGFKRGITTFNQYAPERLYRRLNYKGKEYDLNTYIKQLHNMYSSNNPVAIEINQSMIKDFYLNNWINYKVVPRVDDIDIVSLLKSEYSDNKLIYKSSIKDKVYPYLLTEDNRLLEYIGVSKKENYPIYKVVNKKGFSSTFNKSDVKGYNILEYGLNSDMSIISDNNILTQQEMNIDIQSKIDKFKGTNYEIGSVELKDINDLFREGIIENNSTDDTNILDDTQTPQETSENGLKTDSTTITQEQLDKVNEFYRNQFNDIFNTMNTALETNFYPDYTMEQFNNMSEEEKLNILKCL